MKRYYFVDYENVKSEGLNGISSLTNDDTVKIYYSKDAQTLTFGLHRRIMSTDAYVEYRKIDNSIKASLKNALDVILLTELNELIKCEKNSEYFIISNDSDFDSFVLDKNKRNIAISKIPEICVRHKAQTIQNKAVSNNFECVDKKKKEQIFRSFFGKNMKRDYENWKEEIVEAYLESNSRQEINNRLQKTFTNDATSEILDKISDFTKDLPGRIY